MNKARSEGGRSKSSGTIRTGRAKAWGSFSLGLTETALAKTWKREKRGAQIWERAPGREGSPRAAGKGGTKTELKLLKSKWTGSEISVGGGGCGGGGGGLGP